MWIFPWKVGSSLRRREGLPRRRAGLGETEDSEDGLSGLPRLGKGRLRLGEPATVRGLCSWHVWGPSCGPIFLLL